MPELAAQCGGSRMHKGFTEHTQCDIGRKWDHSGKKALEYTRPRVPAKELGLHPEWDRRCWGTASWGNFQV